MSLFKNIFSRKLAWEQQSFTGIVAKGESIVVFCPENSYQTTIILSHILNWKEHFTNISIILPAYDYPFFNRVSVDAEICYLNLNDIVKPFKNAVIFNFNSNKKIYKILKHCNNSTILDINNSANMQFIPAPQDPVLLLKKFADFFDFSWELVNYDLDVSKSELMVAYHQLIKNRFKNFVLHFSNEISTKMIETIIQTVKHEFAANIYFTGKNITSKDFINIEIIQVTNLLELFNLAKNSDILITDKIEIAGTFVDIGITQVFLGKNFGNSTLKCIEQKDISALKSVIKDALEKQ